MALSESAKARRRRDFPGLGSKGADGPGQLGLGIRPHLSSGRAFPAAGCAPLSARLRRGGGQYDANLRAAFCRSAHLGVSRGAARLSASFRLSWHRTRLCILISVGARVYLVSPSEIALQTFYQGVLMSGVAIMTFN